MMLRAMRMTRINTAASTPTIMPAVWPILLFEATTFDNDLDALPMLLAEIFS